MKHQPANAVITSIFGACMLILPFDTSAEPKALTIDLKCNSVHCQWGHLWWKQSPITLTVDLDEWSFVPYCEEPPEHQHEGCTGVFQAQPLVPEPSIEIRGYGPFDAVEQEIAREITANPGKDPEQIRKDWEGFIDASFGKWSVCYFHDWNDHQQITGIKLEMFTQNITDWWELAVRCDNTWKEDAGDESDETLLSSGTYTLLDGQPLPVKVVKDPIGGSNPTVQLYIPGATDIVRSSLMLDGVTPFATSWVDMDGDGQLDIVAKWRVIGPLPSVQGENTWTFLAMDMAGQSYRAAVTVTCGSTVCNN